MLKLIFALPLLFLFATLFSQIGDAELVSQKTDIFLKNGKLFKNISNEINIYNRGGEKFTKISLPYSRMIKISKLEACIKDNRGNIIKRIQKGDIVDKSAISDESLYQDDFIKEFTLKHNVYPYSIFYTYQLQEEEFLHIIDWMPVIDREIPTRDAVLNVELPSDYKIFFRSQLVDTFMVDTNDLGIKYSWHASYRDIKKPEILAPPFISFLPQVTIVPESFNFDKPGSFDSWTTYGNWNNELLKGLSTLPQSEITNIHKLTGGVNDTKEKIKILYHYLQDHTRYINITIETGGLKPFPAAYVAENKYGDCKALSNYFKAVLEVAGIRSYYTKVKAGDPVTTILQDFPSQQFNHIILCVPLQQDTVWLDCTSDMPFNCLGTFTQNRDVFIIEEDNSHFTRTPALSFSDVAETRNVRISPILLNKATAVFHNSYKGEKYELFLYLAHSVNESDKSQIFTNNFVEDGFELTDYKIADSNRDSSEIFVSYSAKSDKIYKKYGNDILIDVLQFSVPRFEDPKSRHLPVQIDYPIYKIDTLEYELPGGYSPDSPLFKQELTTEFGKYKIESVKKGNKIGITKSFLLYPGTYPVERYRDFYAFISKVIEAEKNDKILTHK